MNPTEPKLQLFGDLSGIGGAIIFSLAFAGYLQRHYSLPSRVFGIGILCGSLLMLSRHLTTIVVVLTVLLLPFYPSVLRLWHHFLSFDFRRIVARTVLVVCLSLVTVGAVMWDREVEENVAYMITIHTLVDEASAGLAGGEIEEVPKVSSVLWRATLWAHLLGRFFEHPFGIGVGTRTFKPTLESFMNFEASSAEHDQEKDIEYQSYMVQAHNSFVTLIARFGLIFLIPFVMAASAVWSMTSRYWLACKYQVFATSENRVVFGCLLAFLAAVVEASFNVVIESPLYAGLFWFCVGLFVRAVGDHVARAESKEAAIA